MLATIIHHTGSTGLWPKPAEANGHRYPFVFRALQPEEKSWLYRLVPSDPEHLTDVQLTELLREGRPVLRAEWEEQLGHPLGLITIYLPPKGGKSGSRQARFERGPDLEKGFAPPQPTPPESPTLDPADEDRAPKPPKEIGEIDMSF